MRVTVPQLLLMVIGGPALGRTVAAQSPVKRVDSILSRWSHPSSPGAAVLVIEGTSVLLAKGYGASSLEAGTPITPDTRFLLGSVSKQFTAMAIMMLAERGKLSYDDKLTRFFPEFPQYAESISIRHLLHHVAGFPEYEQLFVDNGKVGKDWPRSMRTKPSSFEPTAKDVVTLLAQSATPHFRPGAQWEYSNSGYVLLGQIIEKASGRRYAQFLAEHIFRPLGMSQSAVYDETKPVIPNRASSYERGDSGFKEIDYTPFNAIYGEDNVVTTLRDMFKWDQALNSERLVQRRTLNEAFTPGRLNDGSATKYGFGWSLGSVLGLRVEQHGGSWVGFRNMIMRFPDQRFTVVVLSNLAEFDPGGIAIRVAAVYLGARMTHPQPRLIATAARDKLLGSYELRPGMVVQVFTRGDSTLFEAPYLGRAALAFDSDTSGFFSSNDAVRLFFRRNHDGTIRELQFDRVDFSAAFRKLP